MDDINKIVFKRENITEDNKFASDTINEINKYLNTQINIEKKDNAEDIYITNITSVNGLNNLYKDLKIICFKINQKIDRQEENMFYIVFNFSNNNVKLINSYNIKDSELFSETLEYKETFVINSNLNIMVKYNPGKMLSYHHISTEDNNQYILYYVKKNGNEFKLKAIKDVIDNNIILFPIKPSNFNINIIRNINKYKNNDFLKYTYVKDKAYFRKKTVANTFVKTIEIDNNLKIYLDDDDKNKFIKFSDFNDLNKMNLLLSYDSDDNKINFTFNNFADFNKTNINLSNIEAMPNDDGENRITVKYPIYYYIYNDVSKIPKNIIEHIINEVKNKYTESIKKTTSKVFYLKGKKVDIYKKKDDGKYEKITDDDEDLKSDNLEFKSGSLESVLFPKASDLSSFNEKLFYKEEGEYIEIENNKDIKETYKYSITESDRTGLLVKFERGNPNLVKIRDLFNYLTLDKHYLYPYIYEVSLNEDGKDKYYILYLDDNNQCFLINYSDRIKVKADTVFLNNEKVKLISALYLAKDTSNLIANNNNLPEFKNDNKSFSDITLSNYYYSKLKIVENNLMEKAADSELNLPENQLSMKQEINSDDSIVFFKHTSDYLDNNMNMFNLDTLKIDIIGI